MIRPIAVVLAGSILLVCRKGCFGFRSSRGFLAASPCYNSRSHHERPRRGPQHQYGHRTVLHWGSRSATRPTTTLGATSGFGSSTPDPGAYFPNDDSGSEDGDGGAEGANVGGRPGSEQQQFPDVSAWTLGKEPKGIGTLFEKEDEVIRELSSDEYVDIVREWAPLASFAANEAPDPKMKEGAQRILNALKGMAVRWNKIENGY